MRARFKGQGKKKVESNDQQNISYSSTATEYLFIIYSAAATAERNNSFFLKQPADVYLVQAILREKKKTLALYSGFFYFLCRT